ncbi:MAG: hypothetical protein QT05_C0002G0018 [archaeon GW2011_AR13]|nr:MAG: hypothetical protein QT05_C0002G0018 [archaeon GW2011_AR13]
MDMILEKIVFDLSGTKVQINTLQCQKVESNRYIVETVVEDQENAITSYIHYDTIQKRFIEMPDGIQILGLSKKEENQFAKNLSITYSALLDNGQISLPQ